MAFRLLELLFFALILGMFAYSRKASRRLLVTLNARMPEQDTSGGIWIAITQVAGSLALLTWFGFIALSFHFDSTRPVKPDYSQGEVIPHNNHGHVVFLTEHEQGQLLALERTPIYLALVAIVAAYFAKKATGKLANQR